MRHEEKLRKEAERLIKTGRMPTLQELSAAVLEARMKYANKIRRARRDKLKDDTMTCPREGQHCKRLTGTERMRFNSREEAEQFERDSQNIFYHGDVAHLCDHCGYWHLSHPEWLLQERYVQ